MLEIILIFFQNHVILIIQNDVVAEFNKSFLIKLPGEVYIHNYIGSINMNEDKIHHIPQALL